MLNLQYLNDICDLVAMFLENLILVTLLVIMNVID